LRRSAGSPVEEPKANGPESYGLVVLWSKGLVLRPYLRLRGTDLTSVHV